MADLGDQLRRSIAKRGLSMRATARRAGCSPGYLSNVIHGRKPLTPSVAARLDQALGTGGTLVAYALNPPTDSNGTGPGSGASRHAARCQVRPGQPPRQPATSRTYSLS